MVTDDERRELFDYVMRMTAQMERARDAVEEVARSFATFAGMAASERRRELFATARSFAADAWNADTTQLVNAAYLESVDPDRLPPAQIARDKRRATRVPLAKPALREQSADGHMRIVEAAESELRVLPPWEKEAFLLRFRFHFPDSEGARIMGLPVETFHGAVDRASSHVQVNPILNHPSRYREAAALMLAHPFPEVSAHETQDLTIVVRELKGERVRHFTSKILEHKALIAALAVILVLLYLLFQK